MTLHVYLDGAKVALVSPVLRETTPYRVIAIEGPEPSIGSIYDDATGTFNAPEPRVISVEPSPGTAISPVAFKLLFTSAERVAIATARAYTGTSAAPKALKLGLDDLFSIIDDPRLNEIQLAHPAVGDGLAALQAAGIITADRGIAIRANETPGT